MELTEKKMFREVSIFLWIALFWLLPLAQLVEANDAYEAGLYDGGSSEYRDAADAAEFIERGQASVTNSPQFRDGIRLAAWATEEEEFELGLASAVYYFDVPSWTHYLKITVRYEDVSKDDDIAGRLWMKTVDGDQGEVIESQEETLPFGDTFILRSDRFSEVLYVPSGRHVEDGMVEMHIVASGRDSLDVHYIRVEYLEEKPPRVMTVHHSYDDYWHRWPPYWYGYHYFYRGPFYWPRTSLVYVHWRWPRTYYWRTYRPWYRTRVLKYQHRHPHWYRRYSHADPGHRRVRERTLFSGSTKDRRIRIERRREDLLPNHHASVEKGHGTRRPVRAKLQPVISRHAVTKRIGKKDRELPAMKKIQRRRQHRRSREATRGKRQEQMQLHTVQPNSPSKSTARESSQTQSRAPGVRTQAVRQQNRIRSGWPRRIGVVRQTPRR
jgi:hypothetical protein